MTTKQAIIVDEFLKTLSANEKYIYFEIIYYLIGLEYIPQINRSFLSFKHKINGKIIAKIKKDEIRIKFFACKSIPEKYINALRREMDASNEQYIMPKPAPDDSTVPDGFILKHCTLSCNFCTGGKMRYYYKFLDGKELYRCGAYPVFIPDINENDIYELKRLLSEQNNYFTSIT